MERAALLAVLTTSVSLALSSCRSVEGTSGLPPFYEVYDTPSTQGAEKGHEVYLRPFGSYEEYEPGASRFRALFPLIDFHSEEDESTYDVLPLFHYRSRELRGGGWNTDWMLFPLIFAGDHPVNGSYFAVFPFGGKIRGLLAQDEIDFVLFPIYWHMRDAGRHSLHILWPFINTVWGDGWSGGRFWPFYGSYAWRTPEGTDRMRSRSILWPFYIEKDEMLQDVPTHSFMTFPFYGYRENEFAVSRTYLWPFLIVHERKKDGGWLTGGFLLPLRFGQYADVVEQFDLWPIYGRKVTRQDARTKLMARERVRQYILWPIHRYHWSNDPLDETEDLWVLPFFWKFSTMNKVTSDERWAWTAWPFCKYEKRTRSGDESVRLDVPTLLWFPRDDYDRLYNRLVALFRYRSSPERSGWELLYGTIAWIEEPDRSSFSILGGLVEIGSKNEGGFVRLLYIPWWD